MAVNKSTTVFHRSKSGFEANDPEGWDDFAIIRAYDQAVAPNLNMDKFEFEKPSEGTAPTVKKAKKRKAKRSKWKVGDTCMAVYQDDQRYYKALIKEIHGEQGTAVITYIDYDEDEVVALKDLYKESLWTNAGVDLNANEQEIFSKKQQPSKKQKVKKQPPPFRRRINSNDVELSYDSSLPFMPNLGDGPTAPFEMPDMRNMTRNCSNVPKEALSSMLVSWYMAGYQTGYYRGLTTRK